MAKVNSQSHADPSVSSSTSPPFRTRNAMRVPEAAAYLAATNFFVEELIRNGELAFREFSNGRVLDADDLDEWLANQPKVRITEIRNGRPKTVAA